jgi:hypothetical protein
MTKMNVYKLSPDGRGTKPTWVRFFTKNRLALPLTYAESRAFFDAHPRIAIVRDTDSMPRNSGAMLGDFANLSNGSEPVFSERAKRIFEPKLKGLGRWIELEFDETPYWLFFNTNVVDALDESRSELKLFSDGGLMRIAGYAFQPEVVSNQFLFTLKHEPGRDNLVTDAFVDIVREHRLTGFWFLRLWNSDKGTERLEDVKDWLKPRITGLETSDEANN